MGIRIKINFLAVNIRDGSNQLHLLKSLTFHFWEELTLISMHYIM